MGKENGGHAPMYWRRTQETHYGLTGWVCHRCDAKNLGNGNVCGHCQNGSPFELADKSDVVSVAVATERERETE